MLVKCMNKPGEYAKSNANSFQSFIWCLGNWTYATETSNAVNGEMHRSVAKLLFM